MGMVVSKQWRAQRKRDYYYRKAKEEQYRSRASYKLLQLNERFGMIHPGDTVVDLGASPGGWSQVAVELVGEGSRVFALDMDRFVPIDGVTFIRGDIRDADVVAGLLELIPEGVDVVISDMAPNISGNYSYDHARSIELCEHALRFASTVLKPNGNFVAKMFFGDLSKDYVASVKRLFYSVNVHHPRASRQTSSEVYVIGLGSRKPRSNPRTS
ncbi:MAG: RlmE family RNA methyltransferase [Thermoplasmata archaeon]|nr:RlmE family RNA methyltransferase [Thermoplasmata archaeon]